MNRAAPQSPANAEIERAIVMIAARPETRIGDTAAWAAYEHLLCLQEAGEASEVVTLALLPFLAARARLLAQVADVHLLG